MRKKILSLAMLSLIIISVLTVLNVNIVEVSAPVSPRISFAPETIVNTTANLPIGTVFNWPISTDYSGSDIWGYELAITYNPVVLNVLEVSNGDLIVNGTGDSGAKFLNGTIDNTLGKLSVTSAYYYFVSPPVNVTSGSGTLATVKFNVTGIGDSDIIFDPGTKLIGMNTTTGEDYNLIDEITPASGHILNGYFANTNPVHNVKVTSVSANETSVLSGELVNVTVVAQNAGNVTEKFDVTAYYSTVTIGTQTITVGATTSKTLHFIWDTTSARFDLPISAEASAVGSAYDPETSTTDNTKIDGTVTVRPPILAVDPDEVINTTMGGGDTFTVDITITNAYDLDMAVFNLTWGDAILRAVYIVQGDFFDGVSPDFDVINGTHYAQINFTGASGVTGNGTLATITFRIVTRGGSLITLKPYPGWWTTYWETTPVVISGVHSNYYDMTYHAPGNYYNYPSYRDWCYPTWTWAFKVTVNPKNNGFLYMSYNLTIYANGTQAATEIQTLVGKQHTPSNKRTYTFDLSFTGADWGLYPITANITDTLPDLDADPDNNDYVFGTPVTVRIPGDCDGDGDVDFDDFIIFAGDYGTETGEATYDVVSEMDGDGDVDFDDFIIFAGKYGLSTTSYP